MQYDVVIIGGGHNGLTAAATLARAGQRTLLLESRPHLGGATVSQRLFPDYDARLSRYAYLVSLLPSQLTRDLALNIPLRQRAVASFTPYLRENQPNGCLFSNEYPDRTAQSLRDLTGSHREENQLAQFYALARHFADCTWDGMLQPLESRAATEKRVGRTALGQEAWRSLVEEPLGQAIDRYLSNDLLKGIVFTDAKIGAFTYPEDPSLVQNRTFLYHLIGNRTGEWQVPLGGMGRVADALATCALRHGAELRTVASAQALHPGPHWHTVSFAQGGVTHHAEARYVLVNAGDNTLAQLTGLPHQCTDEDEGAAFKVNLLCHTLPTPRSGHAGAEAFGGTFHLDEGYQAMRHSYAQARAGQLPDRPPAELYCHTLTDPSILSPDLQRRGFHTLTLFGLDLPYALFTHDNEGTKREVLARYFAQLNAHLATPIEDCLARDAAGNFCVEMKSAVDLEAELGMARGNIFHNALTFPFARTAEEVGTWGVETNLSRVYRCGASAQRGGGVSGIPGHNAARKVLEMEQAKGNSQAKTHS